MFKLAAVRKVKWPVTVNIPQEGGKVLAVEFDAFFEILTMPEIEELQQANGDVVARVLVGWDRMMNESGDAPVEFTPETKAQALQIPYLRTALVGAYFEAANGNRAKRKNSN